MDIPAELLPTESQIPGAVITPEQRQRWNLCWATTLLVAQQPDPQFTWSLYQSDMPTGGLKAKVDPGQRPEPSGTE